MLLVVLVTGCITEPEKIGTNGGSTGTFSLTIPEFVNGPTTGKATCQIEKVDNRSTLSISFTDSLGFSVVLSGPGAPVVGDERAIGEEEGMLGGVLSRITGSSSVIYTLTSGTVAVDAVSANRLNGTIEFTAVQREGPNVGSVIHGSGNFSASGGNSST
jgi:hypothetical protein